MFVTCLTKVPYANQKELWAENLYVLKSFLKLQWYLISWAGDSREINNKIKLTTWFEKYF